MSDVPFISFHDTTFNLCAGACVAAEMKVCVTHVGTLSVRLARLWNTVMDISAQCWTYKALQLRSTLVWLICRVKGEVFLFSTKWHVWGRDINLPESDSWLCIVPTREEKRAYELISSKGWNAASWLLVTLNARKSMKQLLDTFLTKSQSL